MNFTNTLSYWSRSCRCPIFYYLYGLKFKTSIFFAIYISFGIIT